MRSIDVLKRTAQYENEIDERDIKMCSSRYKLTAPSLANGDVQCPQNTAVSFWEEFNQNDVRDIGFILEAYLVADSISQAGYFFINYISYNINVNSINQPYPVYSPSPVTLHIMNTASGNFYYRIHLKYIPKEIYLKSHPITWPKTEDGEPEKNALPPEITDS